MTSRDPKNYNHKAVESKWQKKWLASKIYSPDIKNAKNPFYNLWMFPYPSAEGLHAGHAFASTGSDIYGRVMRMRGNAVFQPIGYDSFGIHSENYAIKINENPQDVIKRTTKHYEKQMKSLGHGYDWTRTVTTSDADYYKWTQWLFLKMFEAGLAYKKKATVNFCPSCKTVLADEQVMTPKQAGKEPKNAKGKVVKESDNLKVCERCGTIVEKKDLDQWFFKITNYADRLLEGLKNINWSEKVIIAQRNWIGKSEGMIINFKKENGDILPVYTTRPDTLNTATFIVIADEEMYNLGKNEKIGEFTNEYAVNPLTGKKLPIWKTNYIAPGYGTGNVMGVPAHDERDREFAEKYNLDILEEEPNPALEKEISKKGWGKKHTNFHLRDWLVSRQRYWGAPIPMIYCENCASKGTTLQEMAGWFPVAEKSLPVVLPEISDYKPEGTGKGPLANHKEFYEVTCPNCASKAKRETDVMDTFVDSSWYFLRYPSVGGSKANINPFDTVITSKWLPVNLYFGGVEHSVLHLMYARFITMVLYDLKLIKFEEPFSKFFAHGLMIKDGAKMSKSRGNVVNPDTYIDKFGADTLRLYVMFMGPMDGYPDFRDTGIEGMHRFINRIWSLYQENNTIENGRENINQITTKMHQTIKKVTQDIENFHYNTAISSIMEFVNLLKQKGTTKESLIVLCQLLAPFAPHITEEIWVEVLNQKYSIHNSKWPQYNSKYLEVEQSIITVQINGKTRSQLIVDQKLSMKKQEIEKLAKKDSKVSKWLDGVKIKNVVFVPGKIINFVDNNAKS